MKTDESVFGTGDPTYDPFGNQVVEFTGPVSWIRPEQISSNERGLEESGSWDLFRGDPRPSDIAQGQLGFLWNLIFSAIFV